MIKRLGSALAIGLSTILVSNVSLAREIRFAKGQHSKILTGRFDVYNTSHTFRARKGQKLNLALSSAKGSKGTLVLNIYAYCGEEFGQPLATRVTSWTGVLPCSDQYSIDIMTSLHHVTEDRPLRENYTLKMKID
jgi:hypothetical protein